MIVLPPKIYEEIFSCDCAKETKEKIAINENESFNIEDWEEGYEKAAEDIYESIRHNPNKG